MAHIRVAGELYESITGQLFEIGRQLRQPSGYPFDAGALREHLQDAIEGRMNHRRVSSYPAVGEVFTLSIAKPFTGLEMVQQDGFANWREWQFTGTEIMEPQTKRFMLVQVGYCENFKELQEKLAKLGKIPEGQWRKAFAQAFPVPDGKGPIGVADASWVLPDGLVSFPYVEDDGFEDFDWTYSDFHGHWRWLVPVPSPAKP